MKNSLLFLCALPVAIMAPVQMQAEDNTSSTETPSLVIHHWYGVDTYPVSLEDYNKIRLNNDNTYTLIPARDKRVDGSAVAALTLNSDTYPRFSVENVKTKDVVTSQEEVADEIAEATLVYCAATQSLTVTGAEAGCSVAVFNAAGQRMLSGYVSDSHDLSVASLPAGIYIAVATDTANNTIKFAKH